MSTSEHGHGHGSVKVILYALVANLGIAIAKFIGAFLSGSASLLAEAVHSVVDCVNQVLLLVGNKAAQKPATEQHPLGYGREGFFWSFIVAILLFSLGGLFAIYEGVHKFHETDAMSAPWIPIGILIVSIGIESASCWACYQEVQRQNKSGSLFKWYRQTTAAELLVIFTEDMAALVGLAVALIFTCVAWATGNPFWDAIGSIVVGAVLVCVAIILAIEIKSLMIGEAPEGEYRPYCETLVSKHLAPGARILRFIALQTGPSEVLISFKIHPGETREVRALVDGINEIECQMRARFPEIKWQFVEPDFSD